MKKTKKTKKKWKSGFFLLLVAAVCQSQFSAVQAAIWAGRDDYAKPTAAPVSENQAAKASGAKETTKGMPKSGEGETTETQSQQPGYEETKSQEDKSGKPESEANASRKTKLEEDESQKSESEEMQSEETKSREAKLPESKSSESKSSESKSPESKSQSSESRKSRSGEAAFQKAAWEEESPNESFLEEFLVKESLSEEALPEVKPLQKPFEDVLKETKDYIKDLDANPDYSSQWFALGLARGGMELDDKYFHTFYENMAAYIAGKKGKLHRAKYSEYSKAILALTATGIDARKVNGYNLLEYLADFTNVKKQGFNGPIWALMALKSHPDYAIPKVKGVKEQTTEEGLVNYLLEREVKGGGWTLQGDTAETDITGMTIQALSSYYQQDGYEKVTEAIDRAVVALSGMQNAKTGGFATMGADNVESCVQVVVALCSIGVNPRTDERFIKSKNWTIENLTSYHVDGSGFMHVKAGAANNGGAKPGTVDGMATEQGHYAMVAYQRFLDEKTFLYDMSDVTLREGWEVEPMGFGGEETVTPTPKPSVNPTKTPEATSGEEVQNPTVSYEEKTTSVSAAQAPAAKPLTAAVPKATVSKTPQPTVSANASGASKKKKKKESDSDSGGWDFEGAAYTDDLDGWDFAGVEEGNADAETDAVAQDSQEQRTAIPPFDRAVAGGIIGAAAFEGFKSVFQRKRGRKI